MIINDAFFKQELESGFSFSNVLDFGSGYPKDCIELIHSKNVFCTAVDCKNWTSLRAQAIYEMAKFKIWNIITIENITKSHNDDKEDQYLIYKVYTELLSQSRGTQISINSKTDYLSRLTIRHENDTLKFLEKNKTNKFELIIAFKSLSHINEESGLTKMSVLDGLLKMLSEGGRIFLKLNSNSSNQSNKVSCPSPFSTDDFDEILNRLHHHNLRHSVEEKDGREHYVITGMKKR